MVAIGLGPDPLEEVRDGEDKTSDSNPLFWPRYDPTHTEQNALDHYSSDTDQPALRAKLGKSVNSSASGEQETDPGNNDTAGMGMNERARRTLKFVARHKKGIIAGGVLAGGGVGGLIGLFLAIQPLKIDFLVTRLDGIFGGPSTVAENLMNRSFENEYMARVLKGVYAGRCKSSADPGCVGDVEGKGPVARLYQGWKEGRLENKLAERGIVFGKRGNTLYMHVDGVGDNFATSSELVQAAKGEVTFWDMMDNLAEVSKGDLTKAETIAKARAAVNAAFKDSTLWDRYVTRFRIMKLLEAKYGIKFCVIACDVRTKFSAGIAEKKLAAKSIFAAKVLYPYGEQEGIVLLCMLSGTEACDTTVQKVASAFDESGKPLEPLVGPESRFTTTAEKAFAQYALENSIDTLEKTVEIAKANFADNLSFQDYLIIKALTPIFGDEVAKLGAKAVPVVGWVLLAAQLVHSASRIGPALRVMSYAMTAVAAVQLFMMYKSLDSEIKSGKVDSTEVGSFSDALYTNLSGSPNNRADATSTPLYGALMGGGTSRSTSSYRCNDGSQVPSGQLICPEEKLDRGLGITDDISSIVNFFPPLAMLADLINKVNDLVGVLISGTFDFTCNHVLNFPPDGPGSCPYQVKSMANGISIVSKWLIDKVLPSPFSADMSGGRTFDMMAAGADVASNHTCLMALGCAKLTNQKVAELRSQASADAQSEFEQLPIFARIFSTSTPYSLVSQLAMSMPGDIPSAANNMATSVSAPFSTMASMFSSAFMGHKAFAANTPIDDPFGVIQYGYTADQVPANPEVYWEQHCRGTTITDWMNNLPVDTNTGEPYATTPQPCLLIDSMVQASGGNFDSTLIPSDALNPDPQ